MQFLTHIGTDWPAILFFALLLWGLRRTKSEKKVLISLEDGLSIRGISALMVLLAHLVLSTKNGILMPKFYIYGAGGLAVGLFFFLSGYGLQKQYLEKGASYRQSFLKRRLPSVLIPFALFAVLYWLVYYSLGKVYTFHDLISDIRMGIPFVAYSWFLIAILFFYLFFWIFMNLFREKHIHWMPVAACGWYCLYAFICIKLKYLIFWYDSAHLIPFGMFCAVYEEKILQVLKNKILYTVFLITAVLSWIVSTYFYAYGFPMSIQLFYFLSLSRIFFFAVMFLLLQLKIENKNPVLRYVGKISLEVYLIHGLVFYLLRGDYCYLTNESLFCFLGLTGVMLAASVLSPIDRFLIRSWKHTVKANKGS